MICAVARPASDGPCFNAYINAASKPAAAQSMVTAEEAAARVVSVRQRALLGWAVLGSS